MTTDHAGKKVDVVVVGNVDGEHVGVEQARHDLHEEAAAAADHHATRGLAVGFLIREVGTYNVCKFMIN